MNITIIGAGISGLYSGYLLQNMGHEVVILEARERFGGRIYTNCEHGVAVDLGAQWVGSPQKRIMRLLQKFNLPLYKQFETGKNILNIDGHITTYSGDVDEYGDDMTKFIQKIDELSLGAELNNQLDNISIKQWIRSNNFNATLRELIILIVHIDLGWDFEKISLYFWLYFIRTCGGYANITSKAGGAQEYKIKGGVIQLIACLANNLNIKLNEAVHSIHQYTDKCIVKTNNCDYASDIVIVSIPPQFNKSITYYPKLPNEKYHLYNSLRMSKIKKCVIIYDQPFWRELGYSGEILSNVYPIQLSLDYSNDDYYALVCFICDKWLANIPSKDDILQVFANYFNDKRALTPKLFIEKDWSQDKWSHGCYFTVPNMGIMSKYQDTLQTNFARLYWVGTETANEWMGYMEGALESAERVVKQINCSSN